MKPYSGMHNMLALSIVNTHLNTLRVPMAGLSVRSEASVAEGRTCLLHIIITREHAVDPNYTSR